MIIGTPSYMCPEQVHSQPLDARSDLFSLGCLLMQCSPANHRSPGPIRSSRFERWSRKTRHRCDASCRICPVRWPRSFNGCWPSSPRTGRRTRSKVIEELRCRNCSCNPRSACLPDCRRCWDAKWPWPVSSWAGRAGPASERCWPRLWSVGGSSSIIWSTSARFARQRQSWLFAVGAGGHHHCDRQIGAGRSSRPGRPPTCRRFGLVCCIRFQAPWPPAKGRSPTRSRWPSTKSTRPAACWGAGKSKPWCATASRRPRLPRRTPKG